MCAVKDKKYRIVVQKGIQHTGEPYYPYYYLVGKYDHSQYGFILTVFHIRDLTHLTVEEIKEKLIMINGHPKVIEFLFKTEEDAQKVITDFIEPYIIMDELLKNS